MTSFRIYRQIDGQMDMAKWTQLVTLIICICIFIYSLTFPSWKLNIPGSGYFNLMTDKTTTINDVRLVCPKKIIR